ncbi:mannitol dehydrogenase family protein [Aliishimia ponticola]|uniref:Mannitol dehydrogenase family protein n=1 Tax=Aliishimia ponticola TaxID=2499833 RepID=A0A4S4N6M1_9RHOB|nr:mannitol dehydrogenase family protein [Aliishimia ponticola]THH34782.1 mannitol dehydrogenase family protein [Aliishimia ponticola]
MTSAPRLSSLAGINEGVTLPGYDPSAHGAGIVHLGMGAFHRAHQAVYTDAALASGGGYWRIIGVSLRSRTAVDQVAPQNGLFTVLERSSAGTSARIIGSIADVVGGEGAAAQALSQMTRPQTRIVTMTVTEKAYGIDRETGGAEVSHPAVAGDLAHPDAPKGVLGLLVAALRVRREQGTPPFTVLCCDNLPENGALLRGGVIDFARRIDGPLADWIAETVPFPSCMVDRITPAATESTLKDAIRATGFADRAAIETEPFTQWVIEDRFADGRPDWEAGGAVFVDDVRPYELMKLRMLNGAHSMLAYAGHLAGHVHVRDVMTDPDLSLLVERQMCAAQATLPVVEAVDLDMYRADLLDRFRNTAIAHATVQIAMDGTQKLPQRIFAPALDAMRAGQDLGPYAFATAAWMCFVVRHKNSAEAVLRDPMADVLRDSLSSAQSAPEIVAALSAIKGVVPQGLSQDKGWRNAVTARLGRMLTDGIRAAITAEIEIG